MILKPVYGCLFWTLLFAATAVADVSVHSSGGKLWLIADADDNDFTITTDWNGYFTVIKVVGHGDTQIDGQDDATFPFPIGDIIVEGPWYNGTGDTSVRVHSVYGLGGNFEFRNVEEVEIYNSWTYRDIILGCPRNVWIYNVYARDIRSIHDYAANSIDISYSEVTRDVNLYGRYVDMYDVEVGATVYLYGTSASDDFNLYRVEGRTYSQKPKIYSYLRSGNDFMTLRNCRASYLYTNGSYGTDTLYLNNRGNSIDSQRRSSIEYVK